MYNLKAFMVFGNEDEYKAYTDDRGISPIEYPLLTKIEQVQGHHKPTIYHMGTWAKNKDVVDLLGRIEKTYGFKSEDFPQ